VIAAAIVAAEAGFWVLLAAGLGARYLLRRPRLGAGLLIAVPLVDVFLLAVTVVDLRGGATAGGAHGLAAVYIGVSVAFGHRMVRWADARVAHRFAGGPPPPPPPRDGAAHAREERARWYRHLLAFSVGAGTIAAITLAVGDWDRTEALWVTVGTWGVVLVADLLWSFSYTLWPRGGRRPSRAGAIGGR
jgi:hypothetical protein